MCGWVRGCGGGVSVVVVVCEEGGGGVYSVEWLWLVKMRLFPHLVVDEAGDRKAYMCEASGRRSIVRNLRCGRMYFRLRRGQWDAYASPCLPVTSGAPSQQAISSGCRNCCEDNIWVG